MTQGYFRFPTIFGDKICFVSEDDLWEVPISGGLARRLTAGLGASSHPSYSPDGKWLAFSSAEEGHTEVFVMASCGGEIRRLTYLGSQALVCGWMDERTILFASNAFEGQRVSSICCVDLHNGSPESLKLGPSTNLVCCSADGAVVVERSTLRGEPAYWKRYRGGTAGKFFSAANLQSEFKPFLSSLNGNLARPFFFKDRVYFISDHEGAGRLYSCSLQGEDIRLMASHPQFYIRHPATDGRNIVYAAGADLYLLPDGAGTPTQIEVQDASQRTQRQRKFVPVDEHLESVCLQSGGEQVAVTARGQVHFMRNWEGPVGTLRQPGVRFRMGCFSPDGKRLLAVSDATNGEESLHIHDLEGGESRVLRHPEWGRFVELVVAPQGERAAFTNHKNEVWSVELASGASKRLARSEYQVVQGIDWSPDGRWLAFNLSLTWSRACICIAHIESGDLHTVTEPVLNDFAPSFDPEGRYLYFLSQRKFDPVYDNLQFELSFPKGILPCVLTLQRDTPSPFLETKSSAPAAPSGSESKKDESQALEVKIDFEGIQARVLSFPLPEAKYTRIAGLKGKVLLQSEPVEGALSTSWGPADPPPKNGLEVYDFALQKAEVLIQGMSSFSLSPDAGFLVARQGKKLRLIKAGEKPDEATASEPAGRKSGWIDLKRIKMLIEPVAEWKQMIHEVWRLQRDHFWREDMSNVNWKAVLDRYLPLVDRVGSRAEFGDLVWEMQGELGTSHAYDIGGDYRPQRSYPVGLLGADMVYDKDKGGYRIDRFLEGDSWNPAEACPLRAPGIQLETGDVLTAINDQALSQDLTPGHLLLHQAGAEVKLSVLSKEGARRQVRVKTLTQESSLRYRDWVEHNRQYVRKASMNRVGYIHVPDMGPRGFAEFHRHFLRDFDQDGLIVDVRYNGGGHVSQLLLEKLTRVRLGADETRWFGTMPFPDQSPAGPIVALTNEYAGSDGDIFSHSFKMKNLGPLIGRRTWGGVVGIWPRHRLVDGGVTTQPEFSHWFADVGWQIENYGAVPDIDLDILPHHFRQDVDPQLDRAVREVLLRLESNPPFRPVLDDYPDLGFEI